jgi:recombinational DNA repair protein (RecF pathway)
MLRLAGILPSLRSCISCGEALGRPLRFDQKLEGFVCANCATRDAFVLSNDVADALDTLLRLPVEELVAGAFPVETLMEVRSLSGFIRRNFLGHELKSFEVLASVIGG